MGHLRRWFVKIREGNLSAIGDITLRRNFRICGASKARSRGLWNFLKLHTKEYKNIPKDIKSEKRTVKCISAKGFSLEFIESLSIHVTSGAAFGAIASTKIFD